MRRAALTAAFALAAALAHAQAPATRDAASGARVSAAQNADQGFSLARPSRADAAPEAAAFEFEAGGFRYHVAANGHGRRTKGDRTRRFNLQLDGRDFIEGFYFDFYEGDLLLACLLTDGDSGEGLILRVEQPSMRALWRQHVPASNLGKPLRDGRHLYLTGNDFVAKLDLRTGEYAWEHEDLGEDAQLAEVARGDARPRDFESFETPELSGDEVLFRGRPVYNRRRTLVVNRKTGKIIRIE